MSRAVTSAAKLHEPRPHDYAHGPTRRERMILGMAEDGLSRRAIVQQTRLSDAYVAQVITNLLAPKMTDWQSPARASSAALARALRTHFPERCLEER